MVLPNNSLKLTLSWAFIRECPASALKRGRDRTGTSKKKIT